MDPMLICTILSYWCDFTPHVTALSVINSQIVLTEVKLEIAALKKLNKGESDSMRDLNALKDDLELAEEGKPTPTPASAEMTM